MEFVDILQVCGSACVVALVVSEEQQTRVRFIAKPLASLVFILTANAAGCQESEYGQCVLVALVLSALGDIALLGKSEKLFLFGLILFLFGHVGYVVAFLKRGIDANTAAFGVLAVLPIALAVMRWLWPHLPPPMRIPVIAYTLVISSMVTAAIGTLTTAQNDTNIMLAAIYFFVSDIFVARERFVISHSLNQSLGLPIYYAAQNLFAYTTIGSKAVPASSLSFPLAFFALRLLSTPLLKKSQKQA